MPIRIRILLPLALLIANPARGSGRESDLRKVFYRVPSVTEGQLTVSSADPDLAVVELRKDGRPVFVDASSEPLTRLGAFTTTYHDVPPGEYLLVLSDIVGNTTETPINFAELSLSLRPASPPQSGVVLAADATAGISRFIIYSTDSQKGLFIIRSGQPSLYGSNRSATFKGLREGNYIAEVIDGDENSTNIAFSLHEADRVPVLIGTSSTVHHNTPYGSRIVVIPQETVRLTFRRVKRSGNTRWAYSRVPPPRGFKAYRGISKVLTSDAIFSGPVKIELPYRADALQLREEEALRIFRLDPNIPRGYEDVTTHNDAKLHRLTGKARALGTFMLAYPEDAMFHSIRLKRHWWNRSAAEIKSPHHIPIALKRVRPSTPGIREFFDSNMACGYTRVGDIFLATAGNFSAPSTTLMLTNGPAVARHLAPRDGTRFGLFRFSTMTSQSELTSELMQEATSPMRVPLAEGQGLFAIFAVTDKTAPSTKFEIWGGWSDGPGRMRAPYPSFQFRFQAADNERDCYSSGISTTEYSFDSEAPRRATPGSIVETAEMSPGEHVVSFWSTDRFGNREPTNTITVFVDPPSY